MGSPDFQSREFLNFCRACYEVRRFKPSMTVGQLQTVLLVASSPRPMSFHEVADAVGLEYGAAAQHIAQIAEGKGKKPGQGLLKRIPGPDRRSKLVTISRTGKAVACCFALEEERQGARDFAEEDRNRMLSEHLRRSTLPALQAVVSFSSTLSLGSLCVLLYVAVNQQKIGLEGRPIYELAEELMISNLPRHLMLLGPGNLKRTGFSLLKFEPHLRDLRITLPDLSDKGLKLMVSLASGLLERPAAPLRRPKAEAIEALASPEEVDTLSDDDFEYFDEGDPNSSDDQES